MNDRVRTRQHIATHWIAGLVSILGAVEILMGAGAGPTLTIVVGVGGGAVLVVAPWLKGSGRIRAVPLLVGTVPFAVLTWWSLVTPLLAVVALILGWTLIRGARHRRGRTKVPSSVRPSAVPRLVRTGNTSHHG